MTTINNSHLIEKVGGIEKAREIVEGAPEGSTMYGDNLGDPLYYMFKEKHWWFFSRSLGDWATSSINYGEAEILGTLLDLKDLRTAIAEHDNTDIGTDTRNHLSPSTIIKDLEAERHG